MQNQVFIPFAPPITLDLRIAQHPRPRITVPAASPPDPAAGGNKREPCLQEFASLVVVVNVDSVRRVVRVSMPPIPGELEIYGPEDFAAAAGDTLDQHAERVLQVIGSDPATVLQALIDGGELPAMPPRVPREIANWRCKAVLAQMGLLETVNTVIEAMPEPQRTIVSLAWNGDAKLARRGKTVTALAAVLGLSDARMDELFIEAAGIEV